MNNPDDPGPEIIMLWFDPSLHRFIPEILALEDIPVTSVRAASDAFDLLERDHRRYIVLMDNYEVSQEACDFARTLFACPDLHRRVRLIGLAAWRHDESSPLDEYLELPFSFEGLIDVLERAHASLANGA
jgi:hypothetical protein